MLRGEGGEVTDPVRREDLCKFRWSVMGACRLFPFFLLAPALRELTSAGFGADGEVVMQPKKEMRKFLISAVFSAATALFSIAVRRYVTD